MNTETTEAPKRRSLFEITQQLIAAIEESGGEITDAIDALGLDLRDKTEAYRAVILQYEAECRACKETAEWYAKRGAAKCKNAERLRERLLDSMRTLGQASIQTATCKAYLSKSERVDIADEAAFCATWPQYVSRTVKPDRKAIKLAIESGTELEGASIVESFSVQFR